MSQILTVQMGCKKCGCRTCQCDGKGNPYEA